MASEFIITKSTTDREYEQLVRAIDEITEAGGSARITVARMNNGTMPMLKLWKAWMRQFTEWMNANGNTMPLYFTAEGKPVGQRPMTEDDAHHAFTHLCLGCDENGTRLSWALGGKEYQGRRVATLGEKLRAMDKLWELAADRGIPLINPQDSEYRRLKDEL